MKDLNNHQWPISDLFHKWGPWMNDRPREGKKPPTQYRQCVHPECGGVERRETPQA